MAPRGIVSRIQDDDPSFNPLAPALARAGVSSDLYHAAFDRVYFDGFYGPISAADWVEQDGRDPSTVTAALVILGRVSDEIEGYREIIVCSDPNCDHDDDGDHEWEEETASAEEIRRDVFRIIIEIYGHLPF